MGSVQTYDDCPACNGKETFFTDFDYRRMESFSCCMRCGINVQVINEGDGYAIEAYPVGGAFRYQEESGIITGGFLDYGTTKSQALSMIDEIKENNLTPIFLSIWENNELVILFGKDPSYDNKDF